MTNTFTTLPNSERDLNLSFASLVADVLDWGQLRDLHNTTDLRPQFVKLTEELGEVAAGIARNDPARILDGVGDLLVVLINFGAVYAKHIHPDDITEQLEFERDFLLIALTTAWEEIKNRNGKTQDNVFIKEEM